MHANNFLSKNNFDAYRKMCNGPRIASPSDHLVPIEEQREVASRISGVDYIELPGRGHFIRDYDFPELVANVIDKMTSQ